MLNLNVWILYLCPISRTSAAWLSSTSSVLARRCFPSAISCYKLLDVAAHCLLNCLSGLCFGCSATVASADAPSCVLAPRVVEALIPLLRKARLLLRHLELTWLVVIIVYSI